MDLRVIEKFFEYTEKTKFCWNWKGFRSKRGAPVIRLSFGIIDGKTKLLEYSPRQISLYLSKSPHYGSKFTKPWCGNKLCVNPEHLIAGDEARFWSKVQKLNEPNGCWIWIGGEDKNGYGKFKLSSNGKKTHMRAHRYSWELHMGQRIKSSNVFVCHKCDNPRCVNPDHLFLGNNQDNTADRHAKGRSAKGERHTHRFKEAEVLHMRALYQEGKSILSIAGLYSAPRGTIHSIVTRRNWKHLP